METTNSNKPAYPTNARMHSDAQGLTKRELFAMAAMQGMISCGERNELFDYPYAQRTAEFAVEFADYLLYQLNKTSE